MDLDQIRKAAEMIREADYPVALTGAGSSVPSGIPDFRSAGSGLWDQVDPMEVASIGSFRRDPQRFYKFLMPLMSKFVTAEPNPAHLALARLEDMGRLRAVVTQNIDSLHQRAGSREVIEVHGSGAHATCVDCRKGYYKEKFMERYDAAADKVPRCAECGGILKPDVTLFGEMLPQGALEESYDHFGRADLVIVIGSSLVVYPAAGLPQLSMSRGARAIVVNLQPTYLDRVADVVLREKLEDAVPAIVETLSKLE